MRFSRFCLPDAFLIHLQLKVYFSTFSGTKGTMFYPEASAHEMMPMI
jgi:hypothetical protein